MRRFCFVLLCRSNRLNSAVLPHLGKTLAAVNRSVGLGLEGYFGLLATCSTSSGKILSRSAACILTGITAVFASLRLVHEAALGVKLLLTGCEDEIFPALFAFDSLVLVHLVTSL